MAKYVCPWCNEVTISLGCEYIIRCLNCEMFFEVSEEEEGKRIWMIKQPAWDEADPPPAEIPCRDLIRGVNYEGCSKLGVLSE